MPTLFSWCLQGSSSLNSFSFSTKDDTLSHVISKTEVTQSRDQQKRSHASDREPREGSVSASASLHARRRSERAREREREREQEHVERKYDLPAYIYLLCVSV